ncbi:L-serine ammonia-lyase, iron-sulfur-dependent, subunit alpha [Vibrio sp. Isolate31]|uniref:L-cysteine desulfidase family protein n=1 Tax=unclassified Vibrio TaxID=2614977 RepID=UPI001EFDE1FB|nr:MULTISPECIES: L-serine ammonia-lyase, iron-sulfur-dependent, subunit alpha [unclassified Vibrio]MCG9555820.1 L-serine ammonia-lyase, iron-sulfur-dependent, subunit alpha [Vibrio sp. Isolate32]MCG9602490.1 L-serine ammonia-lyase, iron-sulfur-dependent, subunit alpha [Vibrio sp. Isolate31]
MSEQWNKYIEIIKSVVKPALGCTEPISAAYAASVVASRLGHDQLESLEISVSDNLYKNSMGVFVPRTGKIGLHIASACGYVAGDASADLQVLANITPNDVSNAQSLIDADLIQVKRVDADDFIYCRAVAVANGNKAEVTISGGHTRIIEERMNDEIVFTLNEALQGASTGTASICEGVDISVESIYDFAVNVPFSDIRFMLEAKDLNMALSQEGMDNEYGLQVGRSMNDDVMSGTSLAENIVMYTSAASDARMGGASLPAMSNFGSGNQGIAATVPVVFMAAHVDAEDEKLCRALVMSHLGAIYMKSFYPPLSAFCGNTVTSSATAMAMVYLKGGSYEQCCFAIQNVLSDTSGMVCDGAKSTCAMKVGSSTTAAVKSVMMALRNHSANSQGVISNNIEKTIRNVGRMISNGMMITDSEIIEIMSA